jgi:hypothetical protein
MTDAEPCADASAHSSKLAKSIAASRGRQDVIQAKLTTDSVRLGDRK